MTVDKRLEGYLTEVSDAREEVRLLEARLRNGGPGDTSGGMDQRVTRLETHFEYVRKDLDEIRTSLKKLDDLPTKRDLAGYWIASITVGLAILAITVGGIVGGLAWLDRPAPPPAVGAR